MALPNPFRSPPEFRQDIDTLAEEFNVLRNADSERLRRMSDYRAELDSTRETNLDLSVGETDYGRRLKRQPEFQRHRFQLPFGRSLTVKHSNRIAGRLPDAIVDRRDETDDERHRSSTMEKVWWAITRASDGETQFADASWDSSEIGAAAFEMYFDVKAQMPLYRAIDPTGCLVVRGVMDPHDFERAYRWWQVPLRSLQAQYRGKEFIDGIEIPVGDFQADKAGMVTVVQMSDRNRLVRFALGQKTAKGGAKNTPLYSLDHGYGFVPYVVIPNLGPYRNVWGWADYEFVRELVRYIAVYFGREADILKMVSAGAMKAKGLQITATQLRRILAEGGIVPTSRDGDVEPVEVPQVPAFAESHRDTALEYFKMLGFAPDAAWGSGGAGSGSDRGLQLQPMFELTSMKQKNWGAGLSRMGEMAFRMVEEQMVENRRYSGTVPGRGNTRKPFSFIFGPTADPLQTVANGQDSLPLEASFAMTPKELFDGDHTIRFSWQNRLDPDDPGYVTTQLNLFVQGAQSLQTTLEKLGFEAPEDEIRRIENEAQQFPWIRDGMLKMIQMQLDANQQGQGGGNPGDPAAANMGALEMMQTKDGQALDADASASALPGGIGQLFGGA